MPNAPKVLTEMNWETRTALLLRRSAKVLLTAALCTAVCGATWAGQNVSLAWKASPDPNAVGYAVYYGTLSGAYTSRIDAGTNTNCTVPDLTEGVEYHFVAMAYDANGLESPPSNEVSFTVPLVPATTKLAMSSSENPCLPGQSVTFTATLSVVAPGQGTPTGTVQFRIDGANVSQPVTLDAGTGTFTTSSLTHGAHQVLVEYAGDGNFMGTTNSLSSPQVINTPPVAAADTIQRVGTNSIKVATSDLMKNVSDEDGDALSFLGASAASANGGSIAVSDGWISYAPPPGSVATDSFNYTISDGYGSPVTGTVFVSTLANYGPPPSLRIANVTNGSFVIQGNGVPGLTYRIEYTDDTSFLNQPNWQTLGSAVADDSGVFSFADILGSQQRFYRSVYP